MINISDLNNRYSRFELINWWDQNILKKAKILVIGCGALGNEIIKNLVMLGAGNIFAVDMDIVEKSNLTRSILFRKEDEGKSKAETVCIRAREINDEINIKYFNGNIFNLGLGVFADMDVIICGLDNREARLFVNQSCWKVNKPWIDGAIEVLNGVARVFMPPDSVCYECTMNSTDYKLLNKRKSCLMLGIKDIEQGKIPTTPTVASVIGAVQVQEAVKILHNYGDILIGKGFIFDGLNNDYYIVEYPYNPDCVSHYTFKNLLFGEKEFNSVTLDDLYGLGKHHFGNNNFSIDFNNELVYGLTDVKDKFFEFFGNMNLLSPEDVMIDGKPCKINSFHTLNNESDLLKKLIEKRLKDLCIPMNDIITLRSKEKEFNVCFKSSDIFS